jgi:hypothetical protein
MSLSDGASSSAQRDAMLCQGRREIVGGLSKYRLIAECGTLPRTVAEGTSSIRMCQWLPAAHSRPWPHALVCHEEDDVREAGVLLDGIGDLARLTPTERR